jgi:hypothetical protein
MFAPAGPIGWRMRNVGLGRCGSPTREFETRLRPAPRPYFGHRAIARASSPAQALPALRRKGQHEASAIHLSLAARTAKHNTPRGDPPAEGDRDSER